MGKHLNFHDFKRDTESFIKVMHQLSISHCKVITNVHFGSSLILVSFRSRKLFERENIQSKSGSNFYTYLIFVVQGIVLLYKIVAWLPLEITSWSV